MFSTREEYLLAAVEKFRPLFERNKLYIPPVKVSCGFPSKSPKTRIGECWSAMCTPDQTRQIFISPVCKDTPQALGVLAHELLHSCLPEEAKHGPQFKDGMELVGLEGKAVHAEPGEILRGMIDRYIEELGEYPNPPLKPKEPKKSERAAAKKSFKLHCPQFRNGEKSCRLVEVAKGGDYTVTCSRKSLKLGFPLCPGCSKELEMEAEDFELYKLAE